MLSACAPGPSGDKAAPAPTNEASKDIAVGGPGDADRVGPEHRRRHRQGPGPAERRSSTQMYPNVTIKRTVESFSDLKTTLKLALSSNTPPDVVQANQGYPDMGAFVAAGMLRPMNDYAKLYGWDSYYPEALLKQNSFSSDGKTWQGDTLFGVSQTGEVVGIYYNRQLLSCLACRCQRRCPT